MKFRKIVVLMLSSVLIFCLVMESTVYASTSSSKNDVMHDYNGEDVVVKQKFLNDGTEVVDFIWDDGRKEQVISKIEKSGEMNVEVIDQKGNVDLLERNAVGEIYHDGELIGSVDEFEENGNQLQWSYIRTKYSSTNARNATVSFVAGVLTSFLGISTGLITSLAVYIASLTIPVVYLKAKEYYQIASNGRPELLQHVWVYKHSNYTTLLRKERYVTSR